LSNFDALDADIQILMGLFDENILEEYIVDKLPC
jgi:hypothetical protein